MVTMCLKLCNYIYICGSSGLRHRQAFVVKAVVAFSIFAGGLAATTQSTCLCRLCLLCEMVEGRPDQPGVPRVFLVSLRGSLEVWRGSKTGASVFGEVALCLF